MKKRFFPYKEGDIDKNGNKIVRISNEGWYLDDKGKIRDPEGFEWFGHTESGETQARMGEDATYGEKTVIRDFKIMVKPFASLDPKEFFKHHRKMIEQTMVETGWDYADDRAVNFGTGDDGFIHIYVRMKRRVWKNRENMYAGQKQGGAHWKSDALIKAGALDPVIHGANAGDTIAQDILKKTKK